MGRTYTNGELEVIAELNADADGWTDEATADGVDVEADVIAEIYHDLDAARENKRLLEEHEQAHIAALHAMETGQAALWGSAPF